MVIGGYFERIGVLNKLLQLLLTAIAVFKASHDWSKNSIPDYIAEVFSRYPALAKKYTFQGQENDTLYRVEYDHEKGFTCESYHISELVIQQPRNDI